ncbi:hypothetical protein ZWY2020_052583 [Hordeum vulgare]|nr:hypothetical protein ZWY2020_052583 [Hordeum vulgare]
MAGILAWAADVVGGADDSDDEAAAERELAATMTPDTNIPDPHMQDPPASSSRAPSLDLGLDGGPNITRSRAGVGLLGRRRDRPYVRRRLPAPSQPTLPQTPDANGADKTEEEENPMMETVRSKCITQLLLLGAIDSIQKRYWSKLQATQQIAIMDILLSLLEFASLRARGAGGLFVNYQGVLDSLTEQI